MRRPKWPLPICTGIGSGGVLHVHDSCKASCAGVNLLSLAPRARPLTCESAGACSLAETIAMLAAWEAGKLRERVFGS